MVILDQRADDYILVLVFLQFYLKAVLFFADGFMTEQRQRQRQREEWCCGCSRAAAGVSSKSGAAGNRQTEADCQETISPLQKQSSPGGVVNFISSSQTRSRHEDGGEEGASSAGHELSLVITATNNFPSRSATGDDGSGASARKWQRHSTAIPRGSRGPALFVLTRIHYGSECRYYNPSPQKGEHFSVRYFNPCRRGLRISFH